MQPFHTIHSRCAIVCCNFATCRRGAFLLNKKWSWYSVERKKNMVPLQCPHSFTVKSKTQKLVLADQAIHEREIKVLKFWFSLLLENDTHFPKCYLSCCLEHFFLWQFFLQVASLVNLVAQIKPTDESDYFLLHTIISLISFAVGSEDLPSKERVNHDSFVLQIKDEEAW